MLADANGHVMLRVLSRREKGRPSLEKAYIDAIDNVQTDITKLHIL